MILQPYTGPSANATSGSSTTLPDPPTSISTSTTSSQITLSWVPSSGATSYKVQRSTLATGPYSTITPSSYQTTSYTDSSLQAGTTYYYCVYAANSAGISGGTSVSATTALAVPSAPTSLLTTLYSPSQINLSWSAPISSGGAAITGYKIERSTNGGATWSIVANTGTTSTTYSNMGLSSSTTYTYRVSAINSVGTSMPSNTSYATTPTPITTPSPPSGLIAAAISPSQINLSWSAPTSSGGAAITGYKIERSTNGGATWSIVANTGTTSTTYSNMGLSSSTTYTYRVSAINSVGTSMPSNTSYATTTVELPNPPASLSATVVSNSQINLLWDQSSGADSYRIDRSNSPSSGYVTIATVASTSYSDIGVTSGTTYYYRVYAVNSAGASSSYAFASSTTSVALPNPPASFSATAASSSQINLSWNPSAGATAYQIWRSTAPSSSFANISTVSSTSYTDSGLTPTTTYYYRTYSINEGGISTTYSTASATTQSPPPSPPPTPTGILAIATSSQINLSWNPSAGATAYQIEYSTPRSGPFNLLTTVDHPTTSYSHIGLTSNTPYHYRIYAVNAAGQSMPVSTSTTTLTSQSGPEPEIPDWIKSLAGWWADGIMDDNSFVNAIRWLIQNDIIQIDATTSGSGGTSEIPSWVKNTAKWWSEGIVSDREFVDALKFLIETGVIIIR